MPERTGLVAAGNFIIDHVKMIDAYPEPEMLTNIRSQSSSNGGGPYNVLKDLAKMEAPFPLEAVGLIGQDAHGDWVVADCEEHGIATWGLKRSAAAATSYTDAMTVVQGGQRTFFHHRGANAVFGQADVDLESSRAKWFYLGYLLLLDQMDALDGEGRTEASRVLERVQAAGMQTVVDFASVPDERIRSISAASLPHVNLLFINEIEAGMVTGGDLRRDGKPNIEAIEEAASALIEIGVKDAVVIHFQEGAVVKTRAGEVYRQGAVKVPGSAIVGSTGAGDAFAAGFLYGTHEGWEIPACLEHAVCAAAISLGDGTPSEAMRTSSECLAQGREWGLSVL